MKSLFRSLIISVVAILVTVGVANAVGVFYYDSVNDSFVLDGDMAVSGGGRLDGYFKEINSAPTKDFYINSQRDLTIQLGAAAGSKFGVKNSANSRIFQVDDASVLKLGDNLDSGRQGSSVKVNFSADGKTGNVEVKGETNLVGGIAGTGRGVIKPESWGELLKLVNPKNALIHVKGANLGFGFAGASGTNGAGFYWVDSSLGANAVSNYPMRLSTAGDLTVLGKVSSPNFCFGTDCKANWASILGAGPYLDVNGANTVIRSGVTPDFLGSKFTFGGMFGLVSRGGLPYVYPGNYTDEVGTDLKNPLNVDESNVPHIGCPAGFTFSALVNNTVYMPSVYYCYKLNP